MRKVALIVEHTCKKRNKKNCHPAWWLKNKKESKKSRMQACQCGTTLMSLITSCNQASLLLSSAKFLSFKKKKKKKHLKKPTKRSDKLFFVSIVHTSARFQKKNQSQEQWQVSEKGCVCVCVCVCMLHMKHSENKIPDKWHLKHDKRYFHA